jgi:hypothetical protein
MEKITLALVHRSVKKRDELRSDAATLHRKYFSVLCIFSRKVFNKNVEKFVEKAVLRVATLRIANA